MRLRDSSNILLAAALVVGGSLVATSAAAGDEFADRIEGTFEATVAESTARARIDKQVEKVVAQMAFYKKPFARNQLQEGTAPCQKLIFGYDDDRISIQCDDRRPAVSNPDGTRTTYTEQDGTSHGLEQTVYDDRIVQFFDSENGTRTNTYRLQGDDTLELSVKLDSSQIPEPITYTRTFQRE